MATQKRSRTARTSLWLIFALLGALSLCWLLVLGVNWVRGAAKRAGQPSLGELSLAYSPEKDALIRELVAAFNQQKQKTASGARMTVTATRVEPEDMLIRAEAGDFDVISPDSSIWLAQLDRDWLATPEHVSPLVGQTARYAVSPVVIATWEDVARSMGYPGTPIGWGDILARAQSDPSFKWSHPSTSSASGLLATLAEFYAGAGATRGLTKEQALAGRTLDYVGALEKTVTHYGEGELAVTQQILAQGRAYLDAFVCQEQLVIQVNAQSRDKLVAIHPKEGALWEDHPLALLEHSGLTAEKREVYERLREFLLTRDSQMIVLRHGYRPSDLSIPLDDPTSPIRAANGVNPAEPQTALQIPSPAVVEVVRDVWWYTKRHTNVYLVVDTSGSMSGDKLAAAQQALDVFVGEIRGDLEKVGLVAFSTDVYLKKDLRPLGEFRDELLSDVSDLQAGGNTALLDAISVAYDKLQKVGDKERINAIVAMTDGKENNSNITVTQLVRKIKDGNQKGVPVIVFTVAFGSDADKGMMKTIAEASGGQFYVGDLDTIRKLYRILSAYF
jgi:Ca-activated chloride channel homolog